MHLRWHLRLNRCLNGILNRRLNLRERPAAIVAETGIVRELGSTIIAKHSLVHLIAYKDRDNFSEFKNVKKNGGN